MSKSVASSSGSLGADSASGSLEIVPSLEEELPGDYTVLLLIATHGALSLFLYNLNL